MIKIICLGKLKEDYIKTGVSDYLKRIQRYHNTEIIELKDNENILQEEKELLEVLNKDNSFKILLDLQGLKINSVDFSHIIDQKLMNYGNITFIIGSSNGVTDKIKSIVNMKLSFGDITIPHGLFRVLLLEQIYRGFKILNNETYHK